MKFEQENPRLKVMLLILVVLLIVAMLVVVYFIKQEISKNTDIKDVISSDKQIPTRVKPLTSEQVKKTLSRSEESAENNAEKSTIPLNPEQVSGALNITTDKTASNNVQPLSSEEIEAALKKAK